MPELQPAQAQAQINNLLPQTLPYSSYCQTPNTQAPQAQVVPEPFFEQPIQPIQEVEVPLDIDLPADIDLPPPEQTEIPQSPFAKVQTQSLEEELNGDAKIVELPVEPDPVTRPETSNE